MKKFLAIIMILAAVLSAAAQEQSTKTPKPAPEPREPVLNKKGHSVLPEAKDWSIGFDANFIIDYVGNLFNNSTSNPGGKTNYLTPNTLIAKYMKNERTAYIGILRLGNVATSISYPIADQNSTVTPKFLTTDTWKNDSLNITVGVGLQKFRGKGRLQGIYGAEFDVMYGRKTDKYTYGNQIDETHPINSDTSSVDYNTTNFGMGITGINNVNSTGRVTESKSGSLFGVGIRGFLGIEFFFATKMSLGAQYGWGIAFISQGQSEAIREFLDVTSQKATTTEKGPDLSSFYIDVDNAQGQISLNFYF
jgi:opacity protein-like surface antigen